MPGLALAALAAGLVPLGASAASAAAIPAAADSVPLPAGEARGLAWLDGATLAVLTARPGGEGRRERVVLVVQDRTGAEQRRADLSGTACGGLAYDGSSLWTAGEAEGGGSLLHRLDPTTLQVVESYSAPGHRPAGVAWDGTALWLCDRDSGLLVRFDPAGGEIVREGRAPAFSPQGLAWDGARLVVGDFGTGRLYRVGPGLELEGTVPEGVFSQRGAPIALAWRGGSLWVAPAGAGRAYELILP